MQIKGVIFDLDGVLVSTDEYHYKAWKRMADEEGISFDRTDNEKLRGVSRMASLGIILEKSDRVYSQAEKDMLATRKNTYYREALKTLEPEHVLPGALETLSRLSAMNVKIAVGSSSKNAPLILSRTGLENLFEVVVDGNHITNSKPHPEVFLKAAEALELLPEQCLVVEDANAGVEAALRANMAVIGVGSAAVHPSVKAGLSGLNDIDISVFLSDIDLEV